jgi:hypothetical protein
VGAADVEVSLVEVKRCQVGGGGVVEAEWLRTSLIIAANSLVVNVFTISRQNR